MPSTDPPPDHYCWFDTEFTSLELDEARLLQVAVIVTDRDLRPVLPDGPLDLPDGLLLRNGFSAYLRPPDGWEPGAFIRSEMGAVVARCRASSLTVDQVDEMLARFMDAAVGPPRASIRERPIMAGNSIHNDWFLARRDLPRFCDRLHYRQLDASSFKAEWLASLGGPDPRLIDKQDRQAIRHCFPQAELDGGGQHDAYYDVQASIAEMAWFRERLSSATRTRR